MDKLPYIIAVDFDGTLVEDKFPAIGTPNWTILEWVKHWGEQEDVRLVLWTCRDNNTEERYLDKAVEFCEKHGIKFDAINQNIPEVVSLFNNDTRKVYANLYLDDKSMRPSIVETMYRLDPREVKPWRSNRR